MQQTSEESVARRLKLSGSKHCRAAEPWDLTLRFEGLGPEDRFVFKSPLALETLYCLWALKNESSLSLRRRKSRNSCC